MPQLVKRVRLTKGQMLAICAHARGQAPQPSLQAIADWAATTFGLSQPPSRSAICRALRQEPSLKLLGHDCLDRTRTQPAHVVALDTMLVEAILFFEMGSVALTGRLIIWLGRYCADRLRIPAVDRPRFTRTGWLRHFMTRHGIKCRRAHGEISSVDIPSARAAAETLRATLAAYRPEDVYNMDEAAFFYRALRRRSLCVNYAPALKQTKERVTIVVAANASGSHKLPIMVIGKAAKPRWLGEKPAEVDYCGTAKGWMTVVAFRSWLKSFDKQMAAADRHVVLLVDNATSHKPPEEPLEHVRVVMLPPNTTAVLQPMDQGVIACIKAYIMDAQTEAIMRRYLDGDEDAHKIEMIEAVHWCKDAWEKVSPDAIRHCWQHAGLYVDSSRIAT
jgi:hypothetical protein